MKLRLAVPNEDLGYRFRIHATKVSKISHQWIGTMAREHNQLIPWPGRDFIGKHLPSVSSQTILELLAS